MRKVNRATKPDTKLEPAPTATPRHAPDVASRLPMTASTACPAKDAICRKCAKRGHFQAVCRSSVLKVGGVQDSSEAPYNSSDVFLGAIANQSTETANPWAVTLQLNGKPMEFHVDTGAEVTVISKLTHEKIGSPPLSPSS